jgi:L-fuconolactonase
MTQPIVDSHIHFWNPRNLPYPWLAGMPPLNRAFLPPNLAAEAAAVSLEKIVFVQADCLPAHGFNEAVWVSSLIEAEPRIAAIVAFAPLEQGQAVRAELARLAALPPVKGIRRLIQAEEPGFCRQPDFVRGVQLLPEFGFSFDICIFHRQLGDVLQLVAQCPQVSFVLDHLGKPGVKAGLREPWRTEISRLAAFPNVSCKLSGLVTEADWTRWTPEQLQPYIDHILAAFGPERVMYGGDWPVSRLATSYQGWIDTLTTATAGLSSQDSHKLFYQNAADFYRL